MDREVDTCNGSIRRDINNKISGYYVLISILS